MAMNAGTSDSRVPSMKRLSLSDLMSWVLKMTRM